jgi:hypothetical protein
MNNKNLLIGAGVVIVGYFLYKKSQNDERNKRVQNMRKSDESPYYTSEMGVDYKTIPNDFVIKSDGYNTTYVKQPVPLGNTSTTVYSKISGRTDGSFGMGSPISITAKEFEDAYSVFLKQPK